jgi:AcrR family transcriptional regulator
MRRFTMENKPDGRRVKMTKLLLKNALIDIMKTKSIHLISIKEICEEADVNRSTFYRHYNTQYDLYDEIIEDLAADIGTIYKDDYATVEFLTKVLEYIESKRDTFLVILSDNGKVTLGEAFVLFTGRFLRLDEMGELVTYVTEFIAAGLTSTIWSRLNKENRRPASEVARVLHNLMMHGIGRVSRLSGILKEMKAEEENK